LVHHKKRYSRKTDKQGLHAKKAWPLGALIDHKKKNGGAEALEFQKKNQFQAQNQ